MDLGQGRRFMGKAAIAKHRILLKFNAGFVRRKSIDRLYKCLTAASK